MDAYTLTLYDDAGNPIPIPAIQGIGIKEIRLKEAGEVEDTYEIVLDDERVYTFVVKHGKDGPKGDPGDPYKLTEEDITRIADTVIDTLPKWSGGNY